MQTTLSRPAPQSRVLPVPAGAAPTPRRPVAGRRRRERLDLVEEWGLQSFPASDPPANW